MGNGGIYGGYRGDLSSYHPLGILQVLNALASGFATTAWHDSQGGEQIMKCVIHNLANIPINSTLDSVTLLYFSITKLKWEDEPMEELPKAVALALNNSSDQNPFNHSGYALSGVFLLIPDA